MSLAGAAQSQGRAGSSPDLTGVYFNAHPAKALKTVDGRPVPLTDAGRKAMAANAPKVAASKITPAGFAMDACVPFGPTRLLEQPYPLEIVQKDKSVLLIWEHNHVGERVYLDEKPDPDADPSYMGFSVGHWEGATLVVQSSHFNAATFLDDEGLPHTADMTVVRRLRKAPGGRGLEVQATITDPAMYARPWTVKTVLPLRSDIETEEFVCGQKTLETRYTRAAK